MEYGTADFFGHTLGERARDLNTIAYLEDRQELERGSHTLGKQVGPRGKVSSLDSGWGPDTIKEIGIRS